MQKRNKRMKDKTYISFDWALKRLLRDKANFVVLEGFLSTLLERPIRIHRLLESESNKDHEDSKMNRVDILAEDDKGELLLIEVQGESEYAYFQRILFGASKLVTEYINSGTNYDNVKKVYSINIVYFDLGQGKDFVYHGKTEFRGVHDGEVLSLSTFQRQKFGVEEVYQLYPEYYILKVNDFNRWSRVPLDQWLYFLATTDIPEDADAPGLREAREKLDLMRMGRDERIIYDRYLMDRAILRNTVDGAREEGAYEGFKDGLEKGMERGMEKGRTDEKEDTARRMKADGLSAELIAKYTGLTIDIIYEL